MDGDALLSRLAVSLSIGLLIGLERGWRTRNEEDHQRAAGLRTFALSGLIGGVAGALAQQFDSAAIIGLAFLGFAGAFAAFHWLEAQAESLEDSQPDTRTRQRVLNLLTRATAFEAGSI